MKTIEDLLTSSTTWSVVVGSLISLAIAAFFYWRASLDLDKKTQRLDRLLGAIERVVRDPKRTKARRDEQDQLTGAVEMNETDGRQEIKVFMDGCDELVRVDEGQRPDTGNSSQSQPKPS